MNNTLFSCPICGTELQKEQRQYTCPKHHSFDIAKEGYVHLLPSNRMHSKSPGDDAVMVNARREFLKSGYYSPLAEKLSSLCRESSPDNPVIIDAGCGEGYYTKAIYENTFRTADSKPEIYGVDISKLAVRLAAKLCHGVSFAVASVFALPFADGCADIVTDCFSPLCTDEYYRVLKNGGLFVYVVPGEKHLWELKKVLYDKPYENDRQSTEYCGFTLTAEHEVKFSFNLNSSEDIKNLFLMTPYCYKTPREGAKRLDELNELSVTAEFIIYVYKKTEE